MLDISVRLVKPISILCSSFALGIFHVNARFIDLLQDNEKRTPLHAAAYLGDAEIIELLILSGLMLFLLFHSVCVCVRVF